MFSSSVENLKGRKTVLIDKKYSVFILYSSYVKDVEITSLFAGKIIELDSKGYPPHSYFKYVKNDENFYIFELRNDTDEGLDDYYQLYCK